MTTHREQLSHSLSHEPIGEPKEDKGMLPPEFYKYLFITDDKDILGKIIDSLSEKWGSLDGEKRKKLIQYLDDVFEALDQYVTIVHTQKKTRKEKFGEREVDILIKSDERRKITHNALIDAFNILSRTMKEVGLRNDWRENSAIYVYNNEEATRDRITEWAVGIDLGKNEYQKYLDSRSEHER